MIRPWFVCPPSRRCQAQRLVGLFALMMLTTAASLSAQVPQPSGLVGQLVGAVIDSDTGQPVPGARVSLVIDGAPREVVVDGQSRFLISDVPVGTYVVLAISAGYAPTLRSDVVVSADRQTQLAIGMMRSSAFTEDVRVEASAFARPADASTGTTVLSAEEIRRAPGGLGDVSRLTQSLPGVTVSSDQRNDIVARGGSPSENLTRVDGIEIPNLNHFAAQGTSGGPISMLNTDLIQDATFLAGGFPAVFGDRLSAVLDVTLREGSRERFEADLDLGVAGVGAVVEGPIGRRGSYVVSARRSYLELVASAFGLTAIPHFTNYQGKAVVDVSPTQQMSVVSLGGADRIVFGVDQADLDDPSVVDVESSGWRTTHGVTWRSLLGAQGIGVFALSHGVSTFSQGVRDTTLGGQTILEQRSLESSVTAQYNLTYRTARLGTIKAGALVRRLGGRLRVAQPIGLENPLSTDEARVDALRIDTRLGTGQTATYLQTTRTVATRLDLTVGGRVDHFAFIGATTVTPRVGLVAHVRPTVDVNASFGRYTQMPALVFLSVPSSNRTLDPMRAEHRVLGLEWRPRAALKVTIEGYQKRYRDYPVSRDYPTLSLANSGDFYGPGGLLTSLVSRGQGRVRGAEFFVQQKLTDRLYGQVAYSVSRTEHAAADGVFRRGSFDTPHVLALVGGHLFPNRFELSTKLTVASGRPHTPFVLDVSRAQNRGVLDLDQINARRGPVYQRWDVRMDKRYQLRRATLVTWMEVENLLGRRNVYQYVWNPKTLAPEAINQIGRFIVGGFTFEL